MVGTRQLRLLKALFAMHKDGLVPETLTALAKAEAEKNWEVTQNREAIAQLERKGFMRLDKTRPEAMQREQSLGALLLTPEALSWLHQNGHIAADEMAQVQGFILNKV